ncbi:MAG: protein-L-isoaspartate(D-aspartate) O-methyltransferase [Thermodesulfobacteriota bacterium]|nr:protein-L-isoaspartate(D-aspartate) O-methyltransferase [Thermodesulfobacteriota bacterium]
MLQAIRYSLTEQICTIRSSSVALRLSVALLVGIFFAGSLPSAAAAESPLDSKLKRQKMVASQLKSRGISDPLVLRAMATVPRHLFVPSHFRRLAYGDGPLPIGHGQTISQPYIVAYMTEILHIKQEHKVLEVGTGSGYQAAVLAELTDRVYTIEIVPELADTAAERLKETGCSSVNVRQGDGYHGWPEEASFDAIMVTAAAEFIPPPLLQQLKEGGRMVIPVGSPFTIQHLMLVERKQGTITTRSLMPVRFVPFRRSQ